MADRIIRVDGGGRTIVTPSAELLAPLMVRAEVAAEAAENAQDAAELAAATALASSRYFTSRTLGESGSTTGQAFSTDDGAGNLIFYKKTASGSTEIGRALTPAAMSASTGSELVGDLLASAALPRTVASKLGDTISVLDFIPAALHASIRARTNTTDLTAYVQAAFDYIDTPETAFGGGRTLYFPAGDYRCEIDASNDNPIKFYVNSRLRGDGRHASRIVPPRTGAVLLNMLGRNRMTVEDIEFFSTDFASQCGIYLCRSNLNTNCNNNKFRNVTINRNYSVASVASIGAESILWDNCVLGNQSSSAFYKAFWTGDNPSNLPISLPSGSATPIGGPNTDNRMNDCEVQITYDDARPMTFSSQAGYTISGMSIICGNHSNIRMVSYTDTVGGNFNGPVTWFAPHFEAFGTGNVVHYLDTTGQDFFNGISQYGGYVVMSAGMLVDFDREAVASQPILQGSTFTSGMYSGGITGIDLCVYAFVACSISWRPRGDAVAAIAAFGFSAVTTIDAADVRVNNLAGNSRLVIPATAVPAVGTFAKGTRFENVSGTVGAPQGWVITTAGSFGNAGTVVASTTSGSNVITISAAGNLYVGCLINIATATGGPFVVQKISGGTVYLNKAVTNTVLGQTVSFVAPVATALANL